MLLYFFLGILFIELGLPIMESLSGIIMQYAEILKGLAAVKIHELQHKIKEMDKENTETKTRAIGFMVPEDEEYEEDYDDDEDV